MSEETEKILISEKGKTYILKPIKAPTFPISDEEMAIVSLLKECWHSEWMGLNQFLDISVFVKRMKYRHLVGEYISDEAFDFILNTYREHASRNQLDEETIDKDLSLLSQELEIPLEKLRRFYYFAGEEEKPPVKEPTKIKPIGKPAKETPKSETVEVPKELAKDLEDIDKEEE